jgi:hypothetical protein
MAGWTNKHSESFKAKLCVNCNSGFKPKSGVHKYCSEKCKGAHKYVVGTVTTDSQYKEINASWRRYLLRLLQIRNRKATLTVDQLYELLEKQQFKCALSGVLLTGYLEKGKIIRTNASIDRIEPGKSYTIDNVQLVCSALNKFRCDVPIDEFIDWCKKVTIYNEK